MNNISEQKIVVLCDDVDQPNQVILHGIRMASILNKELCLLSLLPGRQKQKKSAAREKLSLIIQNIRKQAPSLVYSTLVLSGSLLQNLEKLADDFNAIMLVLSKDRLKEKLKAFRESYIAFLFIDGAEYSSLNYSHTLLPVDFRKECKDTALWASYLGRFNQTHIDVLYASDHSPENIAQVQKTNRFIQHFLKKLHVSHLFIKGQSSSWKIQFEALRICHAGQADSLVLLGSKNISPLDLLIGLPEQKIIRQASKIPVLCINPRRDMHVLCD